MHRDSLALVYLKAVFMRLITKKWIRPNQIEFIVVTFRVILKQFYLKQLEPKPLLIAIGSNS